MKKLIYLFALLLCIYSCSKESNCKDDPSARAGAVCNDGTRSNATGKGACSGHGGVDQWICK